MSEETYDIARVVHSCEVDAVRVRVRRRSGDGRGGGLWGRGRRRVRGLWCSVLCILKVLSILRRVRGGRRLRLRLLGGVGGRRCACRLGLLLSGLFRIEHRWLFILHVSLRPRYLFLVCKHIEPHLAYSCRKEDGVSDFGFLKEWIARCCHLHRGHTLFLRLTLV